MVALTAVNQHTCGGSSGIFAIQNTHLIIHQLDTGKLGKDIHQGFAQSGIQGIDRAITLSHGVHALGADAHFDDGFMQLDWSRTCRLVASSVSHPEVTAQSEPLTFVFPEVRIVAPAPGARLSQEDTLVVSWESDVDSAPTYHTFFKLSLCRVDVNCETWEFLPWTGSLSIPLTSLRPATLGYREYSYPRGRYRLQVYAERYPRNLASQEVEFSIE